MFGLHKLNTNVFFRCKPRGSGGSVDSTGPAGLQVHPLGGAPLMLLEQEEQDGHSAKHRRLHQEVQPCLILGSSGHYNIFFHLVCP